MKTLITLLLIIFTTATYAKHQHVEHINTNEGYPYKNVIRKAERVELRYSEVENNIECKVIVLNNTHKHSSTLQTVSRKKFNKSPMAACLTRNTAKQILATL
ncbi:hypothetical protein PSECIP111951_00179 [Pseudoalteromonas holothuriae]|uniref:Uncharacterized protein n=1 Tax=Pseudoalteromonas holothuriae TaxID=2963714 RepID=A0A9W4QT73_9GAMM|nr:MULTISPECIES: hypothetical protein [unclassified Pseudoalteromonas]CAH9050374.1 hypothetical protein PSECIP111951_00179 [Pseudoalteromonas sp. CIP111951]CAH9052313.1 hypothetical protein PSECIP111854_00941 [Pseudoalteromonas sp. CIP111854]